MVQRQSQRQFNVAYYARNRLREIARVRARQDETLSLLRDLRRLPCADCGQTFAPHQMDFDHRDPRQKSFRVTAGRAMLMSRPRLLAEVAKCDVVCATCHRLRTQAAWLNRRAAGNGPTPEPSASRRVKEASWQLHSQLLDALRDVACADCAQRYPPCAMDFDHRDPAAKEVGVTRLRGRANAARILAEAAKCDIVCANCHRLRTFNRRMAGAPERE